MFDDHQEEESFPAISGLGARLAERLGRTESAAPPANGSGAPTEGKPPEEAKPGEQVKPSEDGKPAEEPAAMADATPPGENQPAEGPEPAPEPKLAEAAEAAEKARLADEARLAEIQRRQRLIQEQILDQKTGKIPPKDDGDRIGSMLEAAAYGSFLTDVPSRAPSFGASLAMHCSMVVLYLVLAPYMARFQPATIEPSPDEPIPERLVIRIPASLYARPSQLQALNAPPSPTVEGGGGSGHEGGSPAPASKTEPKLTTEPAPAAKAEKAAEPAPKAPEAAPAPEPPAPPARFEMAAQVPRLPGKQTLLQTGSAPNVPMQEDVQLPNIMFSSANAQEVRKPIPQKYVMPGKKVEQAPKPAQELPSQAPPDLELAQNPLADKMGIVTQPTLAAVPKPIPQKFNLPTHRQPPPPGKSTALSASDGESIRLLSLSNQPAPVSEFLVIPGGNQIGEIVPDTSGGTAFGTGSVGGAKEGTGRTAAGDPKGANNGRGTVPGGSPDGAANGAGAGGSGAGGGTGTGGKGTGLGSGTGDGNGRGAGTGPGTGSGTGTSLASGSGPGRGPGTGGGNGGGGDDPNGGITVFGGEVPAGMRGGTGSVQLGGEVATQMAHPQLGSFDVVVVQTSAADALPESAGMLSGQPIYTVYLEIGLPKDWILQYCLATINGGARQDDAIVSLGNPAPVKAPFPMRTKIPQELDEHHTGLIMLHGFLDVRGRFKQLEWVRGGSNYLGQVLIAALRDWEFRPATRDGRAVEVEIVLAIPGKEA